jgi:4-hydroxybenzoate polyprenyltransferase
MSTLDATRPRADETDDQAASEAEARPRRKRPAAAFRAMRPGEWTKNLLVFAGVLFSGKFNHAGDAAAAVVTFACFCAISSAGYLVNDLSDIEFDRRHPRKRHRPIASGELGTRTAWTMAVVLATAGVAVAAAAVSLEVGGIVAGYGAATVAYTLVLKQQVIIDVMTIAGLFILRVVAGAVAVDAHASEWLILCTGMLAAFLGFTKRRQEAVSELHSGLESRPVLEHYSLPFLDQMVSLVTAGTVLSYAIYAVNSPQIGSRMLFTAPPVVYGIFRYLYLIYDRNDTRSTAEIVTRDPGMVATFVVWAATALILLYT